MSDSTNKILSEEGSVYKAPQNIAAQANLSVESYKSLYEKSIKHPEEFWGELAKQELDWFEDFDKVREWNYPNYQWFLNGKLNITYNCLDRHIKNGKRNQVAYIYVDENAHEVKITYGELLEKVNKIANGLKSLGVKKGDTVTIYMAMTIEQIAAILACARIGAIHSVVFGGFSAQALRLRIEDAKSEVVICSSYTQRKGKKAELKSIVNEATKDLDLVRKIIVDSRDENFELFEREVDLCELIASQSSECEPEIMDSEDPLFILYTSGTTGKPKGVMHTTAGYNLYTHFTTKMTFDIKGDEVFWCTADPGWITGHSYIIYGPLSNALTSVIAEGSPVHPTPDRFWSIVEKYRVNVFYTAPTAVRMFMKLGEKWPEKHDLSSLKILGSVGEPINPEAWVWYHKHIGLEQCAIVDTWWQTETGGHMISTYPSFDTKPGRAGIPMLGVEVDVIDKEGKPTKADEVGLLVIKQPWPSGLRTCWGEPERYEKYWNELEGFYFAGDLATKDKDGYIMILGRADDTLSISGHRIGTAEVESALVAHKAVAEAAVIGLPHEIKGECIAAFLILMEEETQSDQQSSSIKEKVRTELGSLAVPDEIHFVDSLPKTRSGKIMRRLLKANRLGEDPGDTSTLED